MCAKPAYNWIWLRYNWIWYHLTTNKNFITKQKFWPIWPSAKKKFTMLSQVRDAIKTITKPQLNHWKPLTSLYILACWVIATRTIIDRSNDDVEGCCRRLYSYLGPDTPHMRCSPRHYGLVGQGHDVTVKDHTHRSDRFTFVHTHMVLPTQTTCN